MTLFRSDSWAGDQPELQDVLARKRADTTAWHAWNQLDRAIGAVRQALGNPDLGPTAPQSFEPGTSVQAHVPLVEPTN